jgi:hypothetical protein
MQSNSRSDLFDYGETVRRKEEGMARARTARSGILAIAQRLAAQICDEYGTVTSDDVAMRMEKIGLTYSGLGNASGSVFRHGFKWTGEVVTSKRPSTHGRMIRVWRKA